jgi:hypothetical protein
MKQGRTLLVRTAALGGEPSFVVACDEPNLRWLANAFRRLNEPESFTLGDGTPIGSDGKCAVEVVPGTQETFTATVPAANRFRWVLPQTRARRCADLIDGMADCSSPCHQYLECDQPDVPVVIVSRNEYDAAALRKMRNAHP